MVLVFVLDFAIYNGKRERERERERERAGCFALFVFLVSQDCSVALPHDAMVCLQLVIVVFPGFIERCTTLPTMNCSSVIHKQWDFSGPVEIIYKKI